MPTYEVEADGETFEIEAPSMAKAQSAALFYVARNRMTKRAEAGAEGRSRAQYFPPLESTGSAFADSAYAGMGYPSAANLSDAGRNLATAGTILAVAPVVTSAIAAPVATGKALLGGLAGSAAGKEAGEWVGRNVPMAGGETFGKVLGFVGGLAGGGAGGMLAPKIGAGNLLRMATGGRLGMLTEAIGGGEAAAASAAKSAAAEEVRQLRAELVKAQIAKTTAGTEAIKRRIADSMRRLAVAEQREARLAARAAQTGTPAPAPSQAPAPAPAPAPASSAAPVLGQAGPAMPADRTGLLYEIQQLYSTPVGRKQVNEWLKTQTPEIRAEIKALLARGIRAMPTNLGGSALPAAGPQGGPGYELAKMLGQVQ